jgi:hypothetical protein
LQLAVLYWSAAILCHGGAREAQSATVLFSGDILQRPFRKFRMNVVRKASGSAGAKGSGRSSMHKLGASGKMSDEQYQKDIAEKLCHICHQPDHIARNCPRDKKAKGGEDAAASGSCREDEMSNGDF